MQGRAIHANDLTSQYGLAIVGRPATRIGSNRYAFHHKEVTLRAHLFINSEKTSWLMSPWIWNLSWDGSHFDTKSNIRGCMRIWLFWLLLFGSQLSSWPSSAWTLGLTITLCDPIRNMPMTAEETNRSKNWSVQNGRMKLHVILPNQ